MEGCRGWHLWGGKAAVTPLAADPERSGGEVEHFGPWCSSNISISDMFLCPLGLNGTHRDTGVQILLQQCRWSGLNLSNHVRITSVVGCLRCAEGWTECAYN